MWYKSEPVCLLGSKSNSHFLKSRLKRRYCTLFENLIELLHKCYYTYSGIGKVLIQFSVSLNIQEPDVHVNESCIKFSAKGVGASSSSREVLYHFD